MQEVSARGGKVIVFADSHNLKKARNKAWFGIELPKADPFVAPILYAIPVQLLRCLNGHRYRPATQPR
jgi:glutamine---fructose-6-phosphate transaminase (isomerizing)